MTDPRPQDLASMLALAEGEQARTSRMIAPDESVLYATWGLAWLVGPGLTYLARSRDLVPEALAGTVFAALLLGAALFTALYVHRKVRGVRGVSSRTGAMYGWSWALGFGATFLVMSGVRSAGASDEVVAVLWTSLSCLVVGLLYLGAGALWQDAVQYAVGAWVLVVGAVGALFGSPGNLAVMAVAGGGGFLAAALVSRVRHRR
jgi:hypothetical protein